MKKLFLIIALSALAMSCRGPEGPPGRDGSYIKDIIDLTITPGEWVEAYPSDPDEDEGLNRYYYCTKRVNSLDRFIYNDGAVHVYRDYGDSQVNLPIVRHFEEPVPGYPNERFFWTETTNYEYGIGYVRIEFTISDFQELILGPRDNMTFRVVLFN